MIYLHQVHTVDQALTFTSGTGKATIAGKDQDVKAGDLMVVPAGTQHQFVNTGPTPLVRPSFPLPEIYTISKAPKLTPLPHRHRFFIRFTRPRSTIHKLYTRLKNRAMKRRRAGRMRRRSGVRRGRGRMRRRELSGRMGNIEG